jgi:hypothetical protein
MSQFRFAHLGLAMAAIGFTLAPAIVGFAPDARAQTVSAAVGQHLQAAQALEKKGKHKEALAQIRDADSASGKTANDSYVIEGLRASIATKLGDHAMAIRSYEALLASGKVPSSSQITYVQAIAGLHYRQKDYPKAITWINRYLKEGGNDQSMRALLTQTYYLLGNCAQVNKQIQGDLRSADKNGRALGEDQLQLLATCARKQNDKPAYLNAIEKLVASYPKKDYWANLLGGVQGKPGFSRNLELDVYRLKLAVGQLSGADQLMEMAQLALQAGAPAEAKKVIDDGFKSNVLGTGPNAARQKRLSDFANKSAAETTAKLPSNEAAAIKTNDGNSMASIGYTYTTLGQYDKGISLLQKAISTVGLKRGDEAQLHLGMTYQQAGKKAEALKALKAVQGSDGAADLARYWIMQINRPI